MKDVSGVMAGVRAVVRGGFNDISSFSFLGRLLSAAEIMGGGLPREMAVMGGGLGGRSSPASRPEVTAMSGIPTELRGCVAETDEAQEEEEPLVVGASSDEVEDDPADPPTVKKDVGEDLK